MEVISDGMCDVLLCMFLVTSLIKPSCVNSRPAEVREILKPTQMLLYILKQLKLKNTGTKL
jgi:hypothetical protein